MIGELVIPIVQSLGVCGLIVHALIYLGRIILNKEDVVHYPGVVTHYPSDKAVPKIIRTSEGKEFDLNTARFIFSYKTKGVLGTKWDIYLTKDNHWVAYEKSGQWYVEPPNSAFKTTEEWIKTRMIEHKGEAFAAQYFPEIYDFKATI